MKRFFSKLTHRSTTTNDFLTSMLMKVVKEDISKILARADITESTQRLSAKKQKEVVLY